MDCSASIVSMNLILLFMSATSVELLLFFRLLISQMRSCSSSFTAYLANLATDWERSFFLLVYFKTSCSLRFTRFYSFLFIYSKLGL